MIPDLNCHNSIHGLISGLDNIKKKDYLTHNLHPYPAKFIPQIPACIIHNYSKKGDTVLDPFCGSGTALLEAFIRQRNAIGLDLNPIATLISRNKVIILRENHIDLINNFVDKLNNTLLNIEFNSSMLNISKNIEVPSFYNIDHWFQNNVKNELSFIKCSINREIQSKEVIDFLKLCLSAIIVRVSNQDSDTRWVAINKNIPDGFTIKLYIKKVRDNLFKMTQLKIYIEKGNNSYVDIITDDVGNIMNYLKAKSIDIIVTSPPYLNSYDYYLYHKLRMFWLEMNHKNIQEKEIGSRNKCCDNNENIDVFKNKMEDVFRKLNILLKKDGRCVFIVGDSIYKKKLIKMDEFYETIAEKVNFKIEDKISFNQRKYTKSFTPNFKKKYKRSHILIFRSGK